MIPFLFTLCLSAVFGQQSQTVDSEFDVQRLMGFAQRQENFKSFEKERLAGKDEVKKDHLAYDLLIKNSLDEYKRGKAKAAKPLDESSAEYKADQAERKQERRDYEKTRSQYIVERNKVRNRAKYKVNVSENQELGLQNMNDKSLRIPLDRRLMYGGDGSVVAGKPKSGSSGFGGSKSSGGSDSFNNSGGNDFVPPPPPDFTPPPPASPDFYEPEVPPPPPSEMQNFDEGAPPPPIFEDQDF
jgi:hypothetical protein